MNHAWSGWPGAYCLRCGVEDPFEILLADGIIDSVGHYRDFMRYYEAVIIDRACHAVPELRQGGC